MELYDAYGIPIRPTPEGESKAVRPQLKSGKTIRSKKRHRPRKRVNYAAILGILFGAVSLVLAFLPRPTVNPPSLPFDASNALSTNFEVTNGGYTKLNNVVVDLGVGQMGGARALPEKHFIPTFESRLTMPSWKHPSGLSMDERITIQTSELLRGVSWADIAIIVEYNPWVFPIKCEKAFRFITYIETDGRPHWRSWPLGEPTPPIYK